MPPRPKSDGKTARQDLQHLLYLQTGEVPDWVLDTWEPMHVQFFDAIAEILGQGNTVVLRPGSGGRAIGIAIWRGESRPPAKWFYDQDELDAWTAHVLQVKAKRTAKVEEETGA